jgi:hypothetical protein
MNTTQELPEGKSSGSGLENRNNGHRGSAALTMWQRLSAKLINTFADKRRSLDRLV